MYIVMEYVPGPSLEKMLQDAEIGLERAAEIIGQIASGLDAAHARGIIHRDIKPSHILFTKDGTAKLVDFGITHVVSSSLTQDMAGLGTPSYMSPEQVTGGTLDARADLFSLGVLSYEILVGRRPFQGTDAVSIAYAIVHAQPVAVSVANPRLPRTLDAVFDRILAKKPAERFASGREFHEALLACLPIGDGARPAMSAKVSRRRTPVFWGLGAVAALVACGFLVFSRGDRTVPPPPAPASVDKAIASRPPVPMATVTISLAHRVRRGTLIVSLDGVPIFMERFSAAKMALFQTTTWDPVKVPAGGHKLRARVNGDNGKTYLSDPYSVELPRAKATALRISFKGATLAITQISG
jgi:serine/threonine-protein kinase